MKTALFVVVVILLTGLFGWFGNQPQNAGPDVPDGKLNSLSFAPYWNGQNPFDKSFPSPAQIDADIQLMADKTHAIRTYASAEGNMPVIPALARKHGVKMLQGAWLGRIEPANKLEIEELVRSANAYPDVVKRVMVGNEVLLRRDLTAPQLIDYIRKVKAQVKQPVSYADVWSMYVKHPELIKEVDFITIHILPYWEDEPIAVDQAPGHIERIYQKMRQLVDSIAPGKAILIGESGWPSLGRQRGNSVPGVVNEAKFIRNLIQVANTNGFDVNIVEATNQGWKSALEGVVGANWGLFSADRKPVFPLTGHVVENTDWLFQWEVASLIVLVGTVFGWRSLKSLPSYQTFLMVVFLQMFAGLWVFFGWHLWQTSYTVWQSLLTIILLTASASFAGLTWQRMANSLTHQNTPSWLNDSLYGLYWAFSSFAVVRTLMLAIDGRYLSFPAPQLVVIISACFGLLWASYVSGLRSRDALTLSNWLGQKANNSLQDCWLGWLLMGGGLALIIGETYGFMAGSDLVAAYPDITDRLIQSLIFTLTNEQLQVWLVCLLVLSVPLLMNGYQDIKTGQRR